jgi:hypothetical protein
MNEPRSLKDLLYAALLVGSWWMKLTCALYRRNRYLEELCRRLQQQGSERERVLLKESLERQNELLRIVATAYASGEPTTLDDLLSHAERDWSLRSSKKP